MSKGLLYLLLLAVSAAFAQPPKVIRAEYNLHDVVVTKMPQGDGRGMLAYKIKIPCFFLCLIIFIFHHLPSFLSELLSFFFIVDLIVVLPLSPFRSVPLVRVKLLRGNHQRVGGPATICQQHSRP
jgi:hypothetical protein